MRAHFQYLSYVLRHKFYVFLEAWKLRIPWLGLIHDTSKLYPDEWLPYASHFYGKNKKDWRKEGYYKPYHTGDDAFDVAWLYHQNRNRHHWQFWCQVGENGSTIADEMPSKYRKEMIADWKGAGRAQGTPDVQAWYLRNRHKMVLAPETQKWVEMTLGIGEYSATI